MKSCLLTLSIEEGEESSLLTLSIEEGEESSLLTLSIEEGEESSLLTLSIEEGEESYLLTLSIEEGDELPDGDDARVLPGELSPAPPVGGLQPRLPLVPLSHKLKAPAHLQCDACNLYTIEPIVLNLPIQIRSSLLTK